MPSLVGLLSVFRDPVMSSACKRTSGLVGLVGLSHWPGRGRMSVMIQPTVPIGEVLSEDSAV